MNNIEEQIAQKMWYGCMPDDYGDWDESGKVYPTIKEAVIICAKQILSIPKLVVLSDNQELPELYSRQDPDGHKYYDAIIPVTNEDMKDWRKIVI